MATEILSMRAQILANAKIMLKTSNTTLYSPAPAASPGAGPSSPQLPHPIQGSTSQWTLVPPDTNNTTNSKSHSNNTDTDVVIFGTSGNFTAAVMVGLTPALEGGSGATPESALRRLLLATCELLNTYIPKVGAHQRNIHGGGVFDEDMLSGLVVEGREKSPSI